MARIDKRALTRYEIIDVATELFLEKGYTETSIKNVCKELDMSPGNVTFYFPTKEHLLLELVGMLRRFQWEMMESEADEGISSLLAVCLELTAMAAVCETSEVAKDFYVSAYTSPVCLEMIRKNDTERAKEVFSEYRPEWTDEQFREAEVLTSGVEYATLMASQAGVSLEARIEGALNTILSIYGVPEEVRRIKIQKVFAMNYRELGDRVFKEFKEFVRDENEKAFQEILKR